MPLEQFYAYREARDKDEPRERRLQQVEYYLERLGESVASAIRQATPEPRFPSDLVVDAPPDSAFLSLEGDAVDLDGSVAYQEIDTTPGPQARRLPAAQAATGPLHLKRVGPSLATIYAQPGETIDGDSSLTLARDWAAVELVSDGDSNWRLYSMYLPSEQLSPLFALLLLELKKITLHLASLSGEEVTDGDVEPLEE